MHCRDWLHLASLAGITSVLFGGLAASASASILALPPSPCALYAAPGAVIFRGTILGTTAVSAAESAPWYGSYYKVQASVDEAILAADGPAMELTVALMEGRPIESLVTTGASYLLYADRKDGVLWLSHHVPSDDAGDELAVLHDIRRGVLIPRLYGSVQMYESRLSGQWFDEGRASRLPGVKVIATGPDGVHETTSDSDGIFRFYGVTPGEYDVRAVLHEPLVPLLPQYPSQKVRMDGCAVRGDVAVTSRSVVGVVRSHDGEVALGATVVLVDASDPTGRRHVVTMGGGTHGFIFRGVPDGRYYVGVNLSRPPTSVSPYPPTWLTAGTSTSSHRVIVTVSRAQAPPVVDLVLPPPLPVRTISGQVVDAAGQPSYWSIVCVVDDAYPDLEECRDFSRRDGSFAVQSVVGRRVHLYARDLNPPRESERVAAYEGVAHRPVTLALTRRLPALVLH